MCACLPQGGHSGKMRPGSVEEIYPLRDSLTAEPAALNRLVQVRILVPQYTKTTLFQGGFFDRHRG